MTFRDGVVMQVADLRTIERRPKVWLVSIPSREVAQLLLLLVS